MPVSCELLSQERAEGGSLESEAALGSLVIKKKGEEFIVHLHWLHAGGGMAKDNKLG